MKVEREHRAADDSLEASNIAMFRSMLPLAVREKFKRREAAAKRKKEQEEKKAAAKKEDEKEKKLKVAAAAKAALASKTKPAARGRSTAAASSRAASVSASATSPKGRGSASTSTTAASPPTAAGSSPTTKSSRKSAASPKVASPKGKQATARASAKKETTPAKATTAVKKTSPKKAAPKKASPKKAAPKKAAPKKAAPKKVTAKKFKNDPSDEDDDAESDDEPLSLRAPVPATPASTRAKPPLATPASMVLKAHSASPVGRKSASPAEAMRTRQLGATITTRTAAKTATTAAVVGDDEDAQLDIDVDHTVTAPKKASPKKPAPKAKRSRVVKVNTPVVPERPRRGAAVKSAGAAGAEGYEISEQEAELATAVAAASSAAIRASIPTQVDPRKRFLPTSPINGDMPPPPSSSAIDTHVDDFGPSDGGGGDAMPTAVRERVVIRAPRPLRGALEACAMYLITQISDDEFGTVSMETVRSDVAALLQVDGPLREEEAKIVDQQIIIRAERRIRAASRSMARSARSSLAPSLAPSASIAPSASVPGTPVSVLGTPSTSNRAGQQSMILSQGVTPTPPVPSFNDPSQLHPASPRVSGNANASALVDSSGDVGGTNTGAAATSMSGVFTGIAGNKSMDLLGSSKAGAVDATAAAAFAAALASGSSGDIAGLAAGRGSGSGGPSTQESFPSQRLSQGAPVAAVGAGGFSPVKAAAKLSFSEPPTRDDKITAAPSAAVSASPRKIDPKTGLPPGVVQFGLTGPLGVNPLLTPPPTPPQVNLRGQVVAPGSLQSSAIKKAAPASSSSHVESIPLADTQTAAAVFSATTAAGSKSVGHKKRSRSVSPAAASTRGGGNTINTLPRDAVTPQRSLVQGVRSPGHSGGAAKGEHRRTPLATVPGSPYTVIEAISDESDARGSGGSGRASNTAINTSTTQLRFDDRANAVTEVPQGTRVDDPKARTSGESVSSALDSQAPLFSAATSMAPGTAGDRSPLEVKIDLNAALAARLGDGPTPQLDASHHSGNESHASGGGGGGAGGADGSMVAMTEGDSIVRGYGSIDQFF